MLAHREAKSRALSPSVLTLLSASAVVTICGLVAATPAATIAPASAARPSGEPWILMNDQTPVPRKSLPVATEITESMADLMVQNTTISGAAERDTATAVCTRGAGVTTKALVDETAATSSSAIARIHWKLEEVSDSGRGEV